MNICKFTQRPFSFPLLILIAGAYSIFSISCDRSKRDSAQSAARDSLFITYTALKDSVDKEWQIMIADDDTKHVYMKRLLLEVSYTNNYDKERFAELNELIDQLHTMRYDQLSIRNSASIDAYDSATFDLTDQVINYAKDHPRFDEFPLMAELINDITQNNNYILMHRIHYDSWVKELNSFRKKYKDVLMEDDAEDMPLFQLSS